MKEVTNESIVLPSPTAAVATSRARLCQYFSLNADDMKNYSVLYNKYLDVLAPEVYSKLATRIAHWTNYCEGSWFNCRLAPYFELYSHYDCVVDLGFGAPYIYGHSSFHTNLDTKFYFVDKEQSAMDFYNGVCVLLGMENRRGLDLSIRLDLDQKADRDRLVDRVAERRPASLLIVAIEVIEHLHHNEAVWQLIGRLQDTAQTSDTYVTLPIGAPIPSHELAFSSVQDAGAYVRRHMRVDAEKMWRPLATHGAPAYFTGSYGAIGAAKAASQPT